MTSLPDAAMLRPADALMHAMARFDDRDEPPDVFAASQVVIVENFAPYVFDGVDAVPRWWRGFQAHAATGNLANLQASFGVAQDYDRTGDTVFFTLPTRWNGTTDGRRFVEDGGWAFVLVLESGAWRIRSYAWAVTSFALE
jgi:hypothetical protein